MPREATIIEIPQDPRDRVLAFRRELPGFIFLLPMIVGFGFLCYVTAEIFLVGMPHADLIRYYLYCHAFLLVFACLVSPLVKRYQSYSRLKFLQQKIRARPDAILDACNPNALLIYRISVGNRAVKPYEKWIDIGLLLIDHEAGEIKFEGDMERWIIPREALISARLDTYGSVLHKGTLMLWLQVPNEEKLLRPIKPIPMKFFSWDHFRMERCPDILRRAIGHFVDPERYSRPTDEELRVLVPPQP